MLIISKKGIKLFGIILCLSIFIVTSMYGAQGDIVYSFKEGKIQFLSEKTLDGKVVGLLKTLKANTEVASIKIDNNRGTVSFVMMVKQENPICASWTDAQPVIIKLNPKPVTEITLDGKEATSSGNVTILRPIN